jgi:hypothetical protein
LRFDRRALGALFLDMGLFHHIYRQMLEESSAPDEAIPQALPIACRELKRACARDAGGLRSGGRAPRA